MIKHFKLSLKSRCFKCILKHLILTERTKNLKKFRIHFLFCKTEAIKLAETFTPQDTFTIIIFHTYLYCYRTLIFGSFAHCCLVGIPCLTIQKSISEMTVQLLNCLCQQFSVMTASDQSLTHFVAEL